MKILFISSVITGGSGRSQRELATELTRLGHEVRFIVDDGRPALVLRALYEALSDLSVRWNGSFLSAQIASMRDLIGRRAQPRVIDGLKHVATPLPQNALRACITSFRPDVLVANSIDRWAWRMIVPICDGLGVPTILYVREDTSLQHLDAGALPTVLVANAKSLVNRLEMIGQRCEYVPSLVDVSITRTTSSRATALAINPDPSRGGDMIWELAARLPDVPFVVQESWPLNHVELEAISEKTGRLANVTFRRAMPPGPQLYSDARVLLVPYRVDNRPRVILEAQANGIPVIAADVPALAEATGRGGVILPIDDIDAWADVIRVLWRNEGIYQGLVDAAVDHSRRDEVDPHRIVATFDSLLITAVATAKRS